MHNHISLAASALAGALAFASIATTAHAQNDPGPNLQLYIEGATYCAICPGGYEDSWAISGTVGLRLWVLADAPVFDAQFVASYNNPPVTNNPNLVFTPVLLGAPASTPGIIRNDASAYPGFTDTLLAQAVGAGVFEGPLGSLENNENKYDPATRDWLVFALGDMTFNETRGADLTPDGGFTGSGGAATTQSAGFQLNVYDITFNPAALPGQIVNFGVWACAVDTTTCSRQDLVNMPNSHDAQWLQLLVVDIPEPLSITLLGAAVLGFAGMRRRWT